MSETKSPPTEPKERRERFTTPSGLPLERLYTEESLASWDSENALGYPGEFPYTRGIYPSMYRGRLWTMRQYAGFGSAAESNQRYRYLLNKGQSGLSVAFDLPTQIGMDSDHALALGEVGKVGVAIDSLEDMERLFDGIPLEAVSTSMTINATAAILLALYAGLDIDDFAPQLSFFFNAHNDLLEEIAKYRAARRLWARLMRERFQARDEKSLLLRFHAQTAGSSLTAQQPENNIVRVAIQALAAVLGGCQSLHTNSMDEALALPTEESALIALRTQQIIANETGVGNSIDTQAGSYAIDALTNQIEERAQDYLAKIDAMGGMIKAIESGFVQSEIQRAAYDFQRAVETREQVVVGMNDFVANEERGIPTLQIDAEIERNQVQRLQALRAKRDSSKTTAALSELERRARTSENLLPAILAAVEAYATVGEISDALRRVYGEYHESVVI